MRHYEICLLIHPDQDEQISNMIERYQKIVKTDNGKVHRHEDLGRRLLAYPISDVHKANYVLLNIECGQKQIEELKTTFQFNDTIIRYLIINKKAAITTPSPLLTTDKKEEKNNTDSFRRGSKISIFANTNPREIDYKNIDLLKKFITETGKIIPARITGIAAQHQRKITLAIKRARNTALLPFCHSHH